MKKTQRKDGLRNIQKQFLLFLSIIVITMMGTAAYLGIHFSYLAIQKNATKSYSGLRFRDLEIISTSLLSPADLEAIRNLDEVADVEPVWQTGGKINSGRVSEQVFVLSLTEKINLPILLQGRLPELPEECAVEQRLMDRFGWQIGDTVTIRSEKGEVPESLRGDTFTITGVANHPDHIHENAPDILYVLVPRESFDQAGLKECSMKAVVLLEKDPAQNLFDSQYDSMANGLRDRAERLALSRAPIRDREIRAEATEKLDQKAAELEEARAKLADADEKLTEGKSALEEGRESVKESREKLAEAKKTMEDASEALRTGEEKLADAKSQLIRSKAALLRARDQLNYNHQKLDYGQSIVDENIREVHENGLDILFSDVYDDLLKEGLIPVEIDEERQSHLHLQAELHLGKTDLDKAETIYHQGVEKYNAGLTEYGVSLREYNEKMEEYTSGKQEYEDGLKKLEDGEKELQEKQQEYEDKNAEFLEKREELLDYDRQLEDAKEQLDALEPTQWRYLRARDNTSYTWLNDTVRQTGHMKMTFSMLFIVISAMVIYSSIQKLVLEQRVLVGVGKALGLMNREILGKYLLFGMSGTTAGVLLGLVAAAVILEPMVLSSSNDFFLIRFSKPLFDVPSTLALIAAAEALAFLSVYLGCKSLLRSSAYSLMQPLVPKTGKKTASNLLRLPLMIRMIPRSMRANPARVMVTILSVAGCCALVVMGYTMRFHIEGVPVRQYSEITDYDLEVSFDGSLEARSGLETVLKEAGTEFVAVQSKPVTFEAGESMAATLVVGDLEEINAFYHITDYDTGRTLPLDQDGLYIHRPVSEYAHLSPGDTLTLSEGSGRSVRASIAAVYENLFGWNFFMNEKSYEAAFGETGEKNQFFVRLGDADEIQLKEKMAGVQGYEKTDAADSNKSIFSAVSSSMTMLVMLMVILAAILAFFVLMSLTNSYLLQKKDEAVIMRINGFTVREVILYLMAEIIADTVIGILLGFVIGHCMATLMLGLIEKNCYHFIRGISWPALLIGAGITSLFSFLVNTYCLRNVKNMTLSDLK